MLARSIIIASQVAILSLNAMATAADSAPKWALTLDDKSRSFSVQADGVTLLGDISVDIKTTNSTLSTLDESLKMGPPVLEGSASDATDPAENWAVPLADTNGRTAATVLVRVYPARKILCMSIRYDIRKPLSRDNGMAMRIGRMPGFKQGMGAGHGGMWTRPDFVKQPGEFAEHTYYTLWQDSSFGYGAAIPLVGGGMTTDIQGVSGCFTALQSSNDGSFEPARAPALAFAWGADPYDITHALYVAAMDYMGNPGKLRIEKSYPEIFNHIGWCSWNAYREAMSEAKLLEVAQSFKTNDFPVVYFIIDCGWQSSNGDKLTAFQANPRKFPNGVEGLVKKLKSGYGLKWVGFWHAFNGYWDGVDPASELAKGYGGSLLKTSSGHLMPHPSERKGFTFYNDYHKFLKSRGADFVKVDNQCVVIGATRGLMPLANAYAGLQADLQESVNAHFNNGIINCMCMALANMYNWHSSNVARSSDDYFPHRPENPRNHVQENVYNSMWYSELAWPDFDEFLTHHPQAEMHAVLRAISAGPVYVSDTPGKQDFDLLHKLIFADGAIPRTDIPARPSPESLLTDPIKNPVLLKAFTFAGSKGMVGAFNVYGGSNTITGTLSSSDAPGIAGEKFAVYEHFSKDLKTLDKPTDKLTFTVDDMKARLFTMAPVNKGFAAIGNPDKFISAKWVKDVRHLDNRTEVDMREGGPLTVYIEWAPSKIEVKGGGACRDWRVKENVLTISAPTDPSPVTYVVYR